MKLYTPRLILRELEIDDFQSLRTLEVHPETYRYEPETPSLIQTKAYLQHSIDYAKQNPRWYYRFALSIRPTHSLRGRITLSMQNEAIQEWEVGWALDPAEWGKGFATEGALAAIDFAFTELQAHRVIAFCHTANRASWRVMEKCGMQREGLLRETRHCRGEWSDEYVYAILDREWRRHDAFHWEN